MKGNRCTITRHETCWFLSFLNRKTMNLFEVFRMNHLNSSKLGSTCLQIQSLHAEWCIVVLQFDNIKSPGFLGLRLAYTGIILIKVLTNNFEYRKQN